ncbi:hypothetical protein ANCCEY_09429 [Ancylostoma ceylanicum]|uniref:RRM domain-containing protein n=1 Tax=Ancylostoma ceylanicum TaxID=53326 RepID=A0A0D6LV23_9BILA|nr:hypothetical protein ANCCEY_09429 [Ancylostoma ceylanicum]
MPRKHCRKRTSRTWVLLVCIAYKRKHGNEKQNEQDDGDATKSSEPSKKKEKVDPEYREFLEAQGVKDREIVTNDTTAAAFVTFNRPPDVRRVLQRNQEYIGGYRLTISKVKPEEEELDNQGQEEVEAVSRESEEGRMLHIIPGSEKREKNDKEKAVANEKTSYKKEKMAKLKANAGKTHSWNALFLGPNAIADTLAEKLGVEKEGGISAIVVMNNAVDAKKAFKALAYSRFRTQPLYLEWAPGDVFGEEKKAEEEKKPGEAEDAEEEETLEPGATVFVKNLSFETTDENLAKLFGKKYRIKSAQVSKKLNPADPGKSLSMGFGFVQFYTQEEAQRAIKELQGELLNGHCLELKISNRELVDKEALKRKTVTATGQGKCTKLLVRNIPFQASIREIESLFSSFGEVKSIRIPRKVGTRDQHRGFGFVDFISVQEAKRAFEALVHSTHIYGRRLVLEWAKNDDSVEEMREKTAEKFRKIELRMSYT